MSTAEKKAENMKTTNRRPKRTAPLPTPFFDALTELLRARSVSGLSREWKVARATISRAALGGGLSYATRGHLAACIAHELCIATEVSK